MRFEDVIVLGLALSTLMTLWFHENSDLGHWRAKIELWENWLGRLFGCRLCFSTQAPFWLLILPFYVPSLFLPDPWNKVIMTPVYGLAATTCCLFVLGCVARMTPVFSIVPQGEDSEPTVPKPGEENTEPSHYGPLTPTQWSQLQGLGHLSLDGAPTATVAPPVPSENKTGDAATIIPEEAKPQGAPSVECNTSAPKRRPRKSTIVSSDAGDSFNAAPLTDN